MLGHVFEKLFHGSSLTHLAALISGRDTNDQKPSPVVGEVEVWTIAAMSRATAVSPKSTGRSKPAARKAVLCMLFSNKCKD